MTFPLHIRRLFTILLASHLLFASCEIESVGNGDLGGNWRLTHIDTLATGGSKDMKSSTIYWGIESNILQVRNIHQGQRFYFQFHQEGASLTIHTPLYAVSKDERIVLTNDSLLTPLGINGTSVTYHIEHLGHSYLTLQDSLLRLSFADY